ncbi:MAG: TOBE domain-containing protein [Pseudomonadota bacterium]
MGEINTIPGTAADGGIVTPLGVVTVAHELTTGQNAVLCVRPEHLLGRGPALGEVTIRDGAFFGTHTRVHLQAEGLPTLVAHLPIGAETSPGTTLAVTPDPDALFILPGESQ